VVIKLILILNEPMKLLLCFAEDINDRYKVDDFSKLLIAMTVQIIPLFLAGFLMNLPSAFGNLFYLSGLAVLWVFYACPIYTTVFLKRDLELYKVK